MPQKLVWRLLVLSILFACVSYAIAASERYDYDPLGRLIRVVNGTSRVTDYSLDAAGNVRAVKSGAFVAAPIVTNNTPTSLRRNESVALSIIGSNLAGASLSAPEAALAISNLQATPTEIKATLQASANASLGARLFTITTAGGSAIASINVALALPTLNVDPAPLAIPPDSVQRQFTLRLSGIDSVDHIIALTSSNNNITVSPGSITIPAGQLSVAANIKGITAGQATIKLSSATLGTSLVPVFITSEFVGVTTSITPIVGVLLQANKQPASSSIGPFLSPQLGVLVGSAIRSLVPDRFAIGTNAATLTINGTGLATAQTVSLEPNTGVTLGSPLVAADGLSVTVSVSVTADAPQTQRRLIVKNAAGVAFLPVSSVSPYADRLNIVAPLPRIDSIEPLFGAPDSTLKLTVRGRNLQAAQAIIFNPSAGIITDAAPSISADGTVLTAGLNLAINAVVGDYAVAVTTPAGTSDATPVTGNTFKVVNELRSAVNPIMAPTVGVVLEDSKAASTQAIRLGASAVGVTVGPVATALSPAVGILGQSFSLNIQGNELAAATSINISPNTGLTIGAATVSADGKTLSVPLSVASDAPQTVRKVRLMAGTTEIPFVSASAAQFLISVPLPEIDSVAPIILQTGQASVPLVVRGRNFQNASQVRITPPDGMTISTPPVVDSDGATLTVNISAAATAVSGPRLVSVVTAAGESSANLGIANTLSLSATAGSTVTPVIAPMLGIIKLDNSVPPPIAITPLIAPAVGVVLQQPVSVPVGTTRSQFSSQLGIALGATALSLDTSGFAPGFSGTLNVQGIALNDITSAVVTPATGITLGTPIVTVDGKQVTIPITVDASAARGARTIKLNTASGSVVFANPAAAQILVGPGVPRMDSITPILAKQGEVVSVTVRGANLQDALSLSATPAVGLAVVPGTLNVNPSGTQLTLSFVIDANAPLGARVMQVIVPGAVSDGTPVPANTFTVFAP